MQAAQMAVRLDLARVCGGGGGYYRSSRFCRMSSRQKWWSARGFRMPVVMAAAASDYGQNHYDVLGVERTASSADIKKAYRRLARKWHPDVSKDSNASEVFKNIRVAYDVLSNDATRVKYDRSLSLRIVEDGSESASSRRRRGGTSSSYYNSNHHVVFDMEDVIRKWDSVRQKRRKRQRYRHKYGTGHDDDASNRGWSVLRTIGWPVAFLAVVKWVGCALPLSVSSLVAVFDPELDNGYKLGFYMAWFLGGRGGVWLTLFLWFASWVTGKANSWMVVGAGMAIWMSCILEKYFTIPRGALLALVYMSFKLQMDLKST